MVATVTCMRKNFRVSLSNDLHQHKWSRKLLLMLHYDRAAPSPVMLNDRDKPWRKNGSTFVPLIHNWPDTESQSPCTPSLCRLVNTAYVTLSGCDGADVPYLPRTILVLSTFQPSFLGDNSDRLQCTRVELTKMCCLSQKPDRAKIQLIATCMLDRK